MSDADTQQALEEFGIQEYVGRWWLNGGEITAPVYSLVVKRNLYPPWWPVYVDPVTEERVRVG